MRCFRYGCEDADVSEGVQVSKTGRLRQIFLCDECGSLVSRGSTLANDVTTATTMETEVEIEASAIDVLQAQLDSYDTVVDEGEDATDECITLLQGSALRAVIREHKEMSKRLETVNTLGHWLS